MTTLVKSALVGDITALHIAVVGTGAAAVELVLAGKAA